MPVDALQRQDKPHVEIVQQPPSCTRLQILFEELGATSGRGSEAEEEAVVTVFEEDPVPTDLVDTAVAGDARHGPGAQISSCGLLGLPGTSWQRRQRASYTSLAPTMMMGSS